MPCLGWLLGDLEMWFVLAEACFAPPFSCVWTIHAIIVRSWINDSNSSNLIHEVPDSCLSCRAAITTRRQYVDILIYWWAIIFCLCHRKELSRALVCGCPLVALSRCKLRGEQKNSQLSHCANGLFDALRPTSFWVCFPLIIRGWPLEHWWFQHLHCRHGTSLVFNSRMQRVASSHPAFGDWCRLSGMKWNESAEILLAFYVFSGGGPWEATHLYSQQCLDENTFSRVAILQAPASSQNLSFGMIQGEFKMNNINFDSRRKRGSGCCSHRWAPRQRELSSCVKAQFSTEHFDLSAFKIFRDLKQFVKEVHSLVVTGSIAAALQTIAEVTALSFATWNRCCLAVVFKHLKALPTLPTLPSSKQKENKRRQNKEYRREYLRSGRNIPTVWNRQGSEACRRPRCWGLGQKCQVRRFWSESIEDLNNGSNIMKPWALAHGFMILEPLFK